MAYIDYLARHDFKKNVSRHSHATWELIYCISGDAVISFDNTTLYYKKGQFVLVPANVIHSNTSDIGFTNIFMYIAEWNLNVDTVTVLSDNENGLILMILEQMYLYYNASAKNKKNILESFLELLINLIMSINLSDRLSPTVEKIVNHIYMNFSDTEYKLGNFIKTIPQSPEHIRRLFLKEKGVSPGEFLINTRLNHARKILSQSRFLNYNITETAELCGYDDSLYFSKQFKKKFGISPKEYRKQQIDKSGTPVI